MSQINKAYLRIEKGNPSTKGDLISLRKKTILIGRQSSSVKQDISFSSSVISRNHLRIEWKGGAYHVVDQNSRNGTKINGKSLDKGTYHELSDGDRVSLANDTAILLFSYKMNATTMPLPRDLTQLDIQFEPERRELFLEGGKVNLQGNLYRLFSVLYENRGKATSHSEIKRAIWPERARDENGDPFATEQEIHVLVMRLRKRLGRYSRYLISVRGHGYIIDFE